MEPPACKKAKQDHQAERRDNTARIGITREPNSIYDMRNVNEYRSNLLYSSLSTKIEIFPTLSIEGLGARPGTLMVVPIESDTEHVHPNPLKYTNSGGKKDDAKHKLRNAVLYPIEKQTTHVDLKGLTIVHSTNSMIFASLLKKSDWRLNPYKERADLEEIEETIDSISTDEVRLCFQLFVHDTDATADEFRKHFEITGLRDIGWSGTTATDPCCSTRIQNKGTRPREKTVVDLAPNEEEAQESDGRDRVVQPSTSRVFFEKDDYQLEIPDESLFKDRPNSPVVEEKYSVSSSYDGHQPSQAATSEQQTSQEQLTYDSDEQKSISDIVSEAIELRKQFPY